MRKLARKAQNLSKNKHCNKMKDDLGYISYFVKYNRAKNNMTQEDLAQKAGVGIRFIRELEQGKLTLKMNKVKQVLSLFGANLIPKKIMPDPYKIFLSYLNKNVNLTLKNKIILNGFIVGMDVQDHEVKRWEFVDSDNIIEYKKTSNRNLIQNINHIEIDNVELSNKRK